MKKILIALAALVVIAAVGIAIFISTFDVNKYKGLIESKAGEALGSTVKIGALKLQLGGGLALGIKQFGVFEKGAAAPVLAVDNAQVSLRLLPLLRKSVEVAAVRVDRPRLTLVREAGTVRVLGVNPPSQGAAKPAAASKPSQAPAVSFLIGEVKVTEGEITFRDTTTAPPSQIAVKHLNVTLKNVSLAGPIRFDADAAIFGEKTDVHAQGEAANLTAKPELRNFVATVDLGLLDYAALVKGVPALAQAGLRHDIGGKIEARADRVVIGPKGPENLSVKLKMTDGRVGLNAIQPYFENIKLDASADEKTVHINDLSLDFSGGTVKAKGSSEDYMQTPRTEVDLAVQGVRIDPLVPVTSEGKPLVEGAVSLTFKGNAVGAAWPQISQTLNGDATLDLQQGILLNLNIIRELLGKLSMFPGIVPALESSLPESYRTKLTRQSTALNPVRHTFPIRDGTVQIRDLKVSTDFFNARLDADARLAGTLDGRGTVQMDKTFSDAMLGGFPQMKLLANGVSQVELPLILRYGGGQFSVMPDVDQVFRNLTTGGGAGALAGILGAVGGRKTGDAAPQGAQQQPAAAQQPAGKTDKISGWLNKISDAVNSTNQPASQK